MQFDGLAELRGAAVVQQVHPSALRARREPDAPERRGAPLRGKRDPFGVAVVQLGTHVVEKQVGIGMELDLAERTDR